MKKDGICCTDSSNGSAIFPEGVAAEYTNANDVLTELGQTMMYGGAKIPT